MPPSTRTPRRRPPPRHPVARAAAMGCGLAVAVAAGTGWMLHDARRTARAAAEHAVRNVVIGAERHIGRTVEGLDLSLRAVVAAAQRPELHALAPDLRQAVLFDGALAAEAYGGVVVTDDAGQVVHDSASPVPRPINVADRDYFRVHRDRPDAGLVISGPLRSRGDGELSISLARRVARQDGSFAGVAVGALRLDHIQDFFATLNLGDRGSMTLFATDGTIMARRPHDERDVGRVVRDAAVFAHLARSSAGAFEAVAAVDGVPRLYAYRQVGSLPLVLVAGLFEGEIYASWTRTAFAVGAAELCMLLFAAGLAATLGAEFRRRARAERAAREAGLAAHTNAGQLQLILNNTSDLLLRLGWDGVRHYVSPASARLLGHRPAELLGRSCYEFVHPEDRPRLEAALAGARRNGTLAPVICRVRRSDGAWRHFEATGKALRDDAGAIVVVRDVTERVRLQERLERGQRVEAIGRLTAGVAHDFNNVLAALLGNLELALEETGEAKVRERLRHALRAGQRGARLTGHLLSFARQQALRPAALDLPPFLTELSRTLERTLGRDVAFRVEAPPDLPPAFVDAAHLDAALLNLALNARDAMPDGGELWIESHAEGDRIVVAVSDTGAGMPPEVLARACEPFFTTKGPDGSGLGLSMVQGFVRQSSGELDIRSAPGRGTRVELRLPVAASPAAAEPRPDRDRSSGRGRVLVVDDDADVARVARAFLENAGFAVTAADGAEAASAALGAAGPFDALVTDFAMPGVNGVDLVLRAREAHPGLPALVITGYADVGALGRLPGDVATLLKPFRRADFVRGVKELIERAGGAPPPEAGRFREAEGVG